jgi:hypothetical protein
MLTCAAMGQAAPWPVVPLPRLPLPAEGLIELRVAHVINPRLPRMSDAQIELMLEQMTRSTQEHFGLQVKFAAPVEISIATVFASIPPKLSTLAQRLTYNPQSLFQRRSHLHEAFSKGLAGSGEPLAAQGAFAQQHAPDVDASSFDQLGKTLADLQLANIKRWSERRALDGNSVIDDSRFHEFMQWGYLGYGKLPYEFIITNQIIASVEYISPSVHSAIRGGYTNGITSYNPLAKFGTYSAWSTYAFTDNDADWLKWRAGESYSPDEAARLAGISAAHELGHQLLHLLHPFGQKGCIMEPVPMFAYRAWAAQLSAKDCAVGSSAAMTPGAHSFRYITP